MDENHTDQDAHWKSGIIIPLKETNLGKAQLFLPLEAIIFNFDYMNHVNKTN